MKVAIVGSRKWKDQLALIRAVTSVIHTLPGGTVIISGGARGVDSLAEHIARERGLEVIVFKPEYAPGVDPRMAPLFRNQTIAEQCDSMLVFWNGVSRGSMHVAGCARALKKPVEIIQLENKSVYPARK